MEAAGKSDPGRSGTGGLGESSREVPRVAWRCSLLLQLGRPSSKRPVGDQSGQRPGDSSGRGDAGCCGGGGGGVRCPRVTPEEAVSRWSLRGVRGQRSGASGSNGSVRGVPLSVQVTPPPYPPLGRGPRGRWPAGRTGCSGLTRSWRKGGRPSSTTMVASTTSGESHHKVCVCVC